MQQELHRQYQVCEEPAPFGIKIGSSIERKLNQLYKKKGRSIARLLIMPFKHLSVIFGKSEK